MKHVFKVLGLATSIFIYHMIQTSRNRKTVNRTYQMGVEDGINVERHKAIVKMQIDEKDMINTKYGRYAKIVE